MKKIVLNKKNWERKIGKDVAVVFAKDGDNLRIIGTAQVVGGVIPKVYIGEKQYSPNLIDPDWMREEYGWKTFSMDIGGIS